MIALTPRSETEASSNGSQLFGIAHTWAVFSNSSAIIQVRVVSIWSIYSNGIVVDALRSKTDIKTSRWIYITCVMQIDKYESVYTIHLSRGLFTLVLRRIANIIQVWSIDNWTATLTRRCCIVDMFLNRFKCDQTSNGDGTEHWTSNLLKG